jgi:hypothetical protein
MKKSITSQLTYYFKTYINDCLAVYSGNLLCLFFDPEDGGDMFLLNIG